MDDNKDIAEAICFYCQSEDRLYLYRSREEGDQLVFDVKNLILFY